MKIEELYLKILLEQQDDDDDDNLDFLDAPDDDDQGVHGFDDGEFAGGEPEVPEADIEKPLPPQTGEQPQPSRPQKLSRTQEIKNKWKKENPGISDQEIDDAVNFFNERKDRLKPYKPYGTRDERTGNFYVNLPEIVSLLERFPNMEPILSNEAKMKDMGNYTWEEISFYMYRFFQQAIEIDDENYVKGDYTEDQRISMALQRWTKPYNRVFNENNIIAYKIECKSEAIALGSLDHAIWRKYNTNKGKQSVSPEILRITDQYNWAAQPWCVSRAHGGPYGESAWTNYRPERAFYFVLDNNRSEWDVHHIAALQPMQQGGYKITTMINDTDNYHYWNDIVSIYPQFKDKERLFPYFGTTSKEKKELTLDTITFRKGDQYDFAVQPESTQRTYIENNRYVQNARCFLTLSLDNRKLYIEKTTKEDDDYKRRFLCTNPEGDPFAILNILKNQKLGKEDLYKFLDGFILKTREKIPEGIMAIKLSIIGQNWKRWISDIELGYTLFTTRTPKNRYNRNQKYGIINPNDGEIVKDMDYFQTKLQSFVNIYDEDGIKKRKIYMIQRYARNINENPDPRDYFYFLYLKGAITDKTSEFYLKGKFFEGPEGDQYVREKINDGTFIKI